MVGFERRVATIPNFKILELDVDDAPWRDDLLTHPFEVEQGHLVLPSRPGLGSDLVETELLRRPAVTYPGSR